MSPSWIWSDKITNKRVARVGYNHFISNKGEWNNWFSKFSNRVLPPIFRKFSNLAHYFPYDVKLRLLAHSTSFLASQKARNAIVGAENLLNCNRSFPSSIGPLFQSESKCVTLFMKMTLICMKMKLHAELIFVRKISHLDLFWNRGTRELGNLMAYWVLEILKELDETVAH